MENHPIIRDLLNPESELHKKFDWRSARLTDKNAFHIDRKRRLDLDELVSFIEGKYGFGKNLNWKSATLDEVDSTPSLSFESLNINGVFLNIGIGYYY